MTIAVTVPATSANLGPGFDCLGLALSLHNNLRLEVSTSPEVEINGEGEASLPRDATNLAYRSAVTGYELSGKTAPSFKLWMINRIPLARGLGSSSAAIVAGLAAGIVASGRQIDRQELVSAAARIEGHPDNVAPAVYGGATVAVSVDDRTVVGTISVSPDISSVVFVPDSELQTRAARAVLAQTISLSDAVFNLGRASLLVAALSSDSRNLLRIASEDRLHQPARTVLIPILPKLLAGSLEAGALMSALSGAGPSVIALVDRASESVAAAMSAISNAERVPGKTLLLDVDRTGLTIAS